MAAQNNIPVKVAGAWLPSQPSVKVGGVWIDVQQGYARVAGVWQQFYQRVSSLAVSVTDATPSGLRLGPGSVSTSSTTASASGGTGPYTYAWTYVSDSLFTINAPANATTRFTTVVGFGDSLSGVYRVTATDSLGNTGSTTVTAFLTETS